MMRDKLKELLCLDESEKLTVYYDSVGVPTIGVGRNLKRGISHDESMYLLGNDIALVSEEASHFPWFSGLDPVRQDVVLDMMFNLGADRFGQFHNMIHYIEIGDYDSAAAEMMDSLWAKQVGSRAQRLYSMMVTGIHYIKDDGNAP